MQCQPVRWPERGSRLSPEATRCPQLLEPWHHPERGLHLGCWPRRGRQLLLQAADLRLQLSRLLLQRALLPPPSRLLCQDLPCLAALLRITCPEHLVGCLAGGALGLSDSQLHLELLCVGGSRHQVRAEGLSRAVVLQQLPQDVQGPLAAWGQQQVRRDSCRRFLVLLCQLARVSRLLAGRTQCLTGLCWLICCS